MGKYLIMVSSITHAIKGRDLLRNDGRKAYIEKTPGHLDSHGCGYSIVVYDNPEPMIAMLKNHGIKITGISDRV